MRTLMMLVAGMVGLSSAATAKLEKYALKGEALGACECDLCPTVCPKDMCFNHCQSLIAWQVTEGRYGDTDLRGLPFAVATARADGTLRHPLGSWKHVIYVSEKATDAQKQAIKAILQDRFGKVFEAAVIKSAPITIMTDRETRSLKIGELAALKLVGRTGANGKVTCVENAPFSIADTISLANLTEHQYRDGNVHWNFTGSHGLYGAFEYANATAP